MSTERKFPFELEPGEQPRKSGGANMQRGAEAVGGRLFLTTSRLVFRPHALNLQTAPAQIELGAVVGVAPAWTKVFGKLPLLKNSVEVTLADGSRQSFVVTGRSAWIVAIDAARGGGVRVG
ncbi:MULTISPECIES: GRAM domain-containing protein [unclassified Brachybacterium]|uniref:GRAM domain-containing protein n=1 Tax=unclassified Brachybacterium TaxID=2623841 RepID=UPI004033493F